MLKTFKIENVGDLDDGRVALMINKQIETAARDCMNRVGVGKAREVVVKVQIRPVSEEDGVCRETSVEVTCSLSIPPSISKETIMRAHPTGAMLFNDVVPGNPDQLSIDEADGRPPVDSETGEERAE